MQDLFRVASLSHKNAPVEIRERMHLSKDAGHRFSQSLRDVLGLEEVLVLSTCNRTEIYYSSFSDLFEEILPLLCLEKGIDRPADFAKYFICINEEEEAIRHLFDVSMGLQSQVIGDLQISNQVKQAYAAAVELELAGPFLHRLLHTIFHANKAVQQETAYRDGAASVSYASAALAKELLQKHPEPQILLVGLGEMGRDIARHLASPYPQLTLCTRTAAKAEALAQELNVQTLAFEDMHASLDRYILIISAVGMDQLLFEKHHFSDLEKFRQKFLIDLCVPRTIAPDLEELAGVVVYDIDDIRTRTDETIANRIAAIPQVEGIIAKEMQGFRSWRQEMSISPVIQRFKEALEDIRKEALARYLKNAGEEEARLVDKVTRSMVNKIIKLPVLQLKAACRRGDEETLVGVLADLFNLEQEKAVPEK